MHRSLLAWYDTNRRDLPWRTTRDPYAIWVSEIMLQQTQVATVLPYYERWMVRFPDVQSLAGADEQDVLAQWQGLGYYRRCRFLQAGARYVASLPDWPRDVEAWRKVPGVGPYTAGAIASIAFQIPAALVDGNVERVFARLTGCEATGPGLTAKAWEWAAENVYEERPGDWNQALMELGATVCKPVAPLCGMCPIRERCVAFSTGRQAELPVATAKLKPVELTHVTWVPFHDGAFGLRQIPSGEWWSDMWEFPRVASPNEVAHLEALFPTAWSESLGSIRHTVTNHRIRLLASLIRADERHDELRWLDAGELQHLPMPAPQRKVLKLARLALGLV